MKTVISLASILAFAFTLNAQITATVHPASNGSNEIRVRNNGAVTLTAFAIRTRLTNGLSNAPLLLYSDSLIDSLAIPVPPKQDSKVHPALAVDMLTGKLVNGKLVYGPPDYEQPMVTAGIFADGTTTGDGELLNGLLWRRSNVLQAVELAFNILSDAGRHNVPRDQLIGQFKMMADSTRRWYLPPEQRIGSDVYQYIVGELVNLPPEGLGSPFPPADFVTKETAMLNQQRVALLESAPHLADATFLRR